MNKADNEIRVSHDDLEQIRQMGEGDTGYVRVENTDDGQKAAFTLPNGKEYHAHFDGGIRAGEQVEVAFVGVDEPDETQGRSQPVITFTDDETGMEQAITVEQVLETVGDGGGLFSSFIDENYSVVRGYGAGLVEIDLHPQADFVFKSDTVTLFNGFTDAGLRPGRYFVLYTPRTGEQFSESELAHIRHDSPDGLLLATDAAQLAGVAITPIPVTITPKDEGGGDYDNPPYEYLELWMIQSDETGAYVTLYDLLEGITARAAVNATLERLQKSGALTFTDGGEADGKPMLSISTAAIGSADFPLDKVNASVWKLLEGAPSGQYGFDFGGNFVEVDEESGLIDIDFNVASRRDKDKGIAVPVTYCIDFSELEGSMTRKLEPYDKRVCIAVAALFNAGYEVMTLQQIYNAMGNKGKIGKADKRKINDSITKMGGAKLHLDNSIEANVYNQRAIVYDGNVIPMERIQALVNGQVVESAIHVFREPPPISFAKERGQFTTVEIRLLDSPLSKTSANIQLEDYLIERIAHIKRGAGKTSNKILFATVYKNTGIRTYKQKQRAPEKIEKLLKHYEACGFIAGYSIEADGVKIFY